MSLSQALALVAARKNAANKSGAQKRSLQDNYQDDDNDDDIIVGALAKIEAVESIEFPNITIYGGDYHGNVLGARIYPPTNIGKKGTKTDNLDDIDDDNDDDNDTDQKTTNNTKSSRLSVLARALAREKGIDPSLLEQKRQLDYSLHLRPVVSGEIHAGSIGSIAVDGKFVVTAGLQDENIRLLRRSNDQKLNKLNEYGALHRHDSTITTVVFTPSNHGQLCLTGGENGIIYVWSTLNRWDCIGVLRAHTTRIIAIAPHPTANMALSLSTDNKLIMWDLRPENFNPAFTTKIRQVKPSWGTQPLTPLNLIFSPNGHYYSILYNRVVHTYHTMGDHAGKIMSVINIPSTITTLWSSMQYLDDDHIIIGNEKGDLYFFNIISTKNVLHLTGTHKYRIKSILTIPQIHSTWLLPYITQITPQTTQPITTTTTTTTTESKSKSTPKKQKTTSTTSQTQPQPPIETRFIVSADSDGRIQLWQIEISLLGSESILIQPKVSSRTTDTDDLDDLFPVQPTDQDDTTKKTTEEQPNPLSYPLITPITTLVGEPIAHLSTSTRITCLTLGLPFDPNNLTPLGNQYRCMGHVMETTNESTTQYEDPTDKLYLKQRAEYAKKFQQQKLDDFKLKVRDYHRMKAGKIKDLSEGDAVRKGSNPTGEKIKGFGREKYRKLDEEFQREHQAKQRAKEATKTNADGQVKKRLSRLEMKVQKRANPSLAGTLRARKRNNGKKGPKTRGKRRW